jgi:mannosyl-3-phosphoglycerate phosphatase
MNFVVFTDLDATLLDYGTYSYKAAKTGLECLRSQKIPLIFATSKTRLEIEKLQAAMQIREPFIGESGAAIFFPDDDRNLKIDAGFRSPPYTVIQLGVTYSEIRRFVYSIEERCKLKGFGDLSVEEIEHLTGLSSEQSLLAKQREFTEPFLLEDETQIGEITRLAASRGIKIVSGGRFLHFMGMRQDKGRAVRQCTRVYARTLKGGVVGDSVNDISMLKSVDIPILMPHNDGT